MGVVLSVWRDSVRYGSFKHVICSTVALGEVPLRDRHLVVTERNLHKFMSNRVVPKKEVN